MPTLQQLRYLVALADTLSFSRAAELCRVSQPTLSLQVQQLEGRLNARLVERTRARVFLTPLGQEVAGQARSVIAQIEAIRVAAARSAVTTAQGNLHLGVLPTVGAYVLSLAVPGLRQDFPEMRIRVREGQPLPLLRQLAEGTLDAALLDEDPGRADLECRHLLTEPLQVVLPSGHPLAELPEIPPGALAGQTVLAMQGGAGLDAQLAGLCARNGAVLARDFEGTTLDTLRQMVAGGMGIALMPALYVRAEVLREQRVLARSLTGEVPMRQISILWRRGAPRTPVYEAIAVSLRQMLAPWGPPEAAWSPEL